MKPELLPYALQDIPRYTSYPTAVQFKDGFPAELADAWLTELSPDASLSLYVHVPFCRQLCWYCGCHTSVPNNYDRASRYGELLIRDIARSASLIVGRRGRVRHLHFGGGTPTYFTDPDLERIVGMIADRFGFSSCAEIAIEIDPRTLEKGRARRLAGMGFNRASLGVQDFSLPVQLRMNRVQPPGLVAACTDGLREAGFHSVNFDLMYGLPLQSERSVSETAAMSAGMSPDRLAVFGYAHVPWFKKHQNMIRETELPGAHERYAQATAISSVLQENGYTAIGLDHFAKPHDELALAASCGKLHRNFQGYTTDETDALLAFGLSAISRFPSGYFQAARDMPGWSQAVERDKSPVRRGLTLNADDRMRAEIIERLMCDLTVDFAAIASRHGGNIDDALARLRPLLDIGLAVCEDGRVTVPQECRLFLRTVASAFDAYLAPSPQRHAKAV